MSKPSQAQDKMVSLTVGLSSRGKGSRWHYEALVPPVSQNRIWADK